MQQVSKSQFQIAGTLPPAHGQSEASHAGMGGSTPHPSARTGLRPVTPGRSHSVLPLTLFASLTMTIVDPSPRSSRSRRPGRRSIDTDLLRVMRLDVDLNAAELHHCQRHAEVASMPLRRWARSMLLGSPPPAAHHGDLRMIWSSSSTLQSQANQLVTSLNVLRKNGDLRLDSAEQSLRELAELAPRLHSLVKQMRVELMSFRAPAPELKS